MNKNADSAKMSRRALIIRLDSVIMQMDKNADSAFLDYKTKG